MLDQSNSFKSEKDQLSSDSPSNGNEIKKSIDDQSTIESKNTEDNSESVNELVIDQNEKSKEDEKNRNKTKIIIIIAVVALIFICGACSLFSLPILSDVITSSNPSKSLEQARKASESSTSKAEKEESVENFSKYVNLFDSDWETISTFDECFVYPASEGQGYGYEKVVECKLSQDSAVLYMGLESISTPISMTILTDSNCSREPEDIADQSYHEELGLSLEDFEYKVTNRFVYEGDAPKYTVSYRNEDLIGSVMCFNNTVTTILDKIGYINDLVGISSIEQFDQEVLSDPFVIHYQSD